MRSVAPPEPLADQPDPQHQREDRREQVAPTRHRVGPRLLQANGEDRKTHQEKEPTDCGSQPGEVQESLPPPIDAGRYSSSHSAADLAMRFGPSR
jgi:hypothetical protein